jgi:hypothetical protein
VRRATLDSSVAMSSTATLEESDAALELIGGASVAAQNELPAATTHVSPAMSHD